MTQGTETPIYSVSADVSWEIDFFGRIRRATEAQQALFLGTQEARRSAVLTLVADVAEAYFELRDFDRRLEIARRTIGSRREYVQFAKDRFEGGVTPELDFRQAEAELAARRDRGLRPRAPDRPQGERALGAAGPQPRADPARPDASRSRSCRRPCPPGCPSELLERRPDIREAEQTLAAATANIGEAKAMLFPRIALTGSFGFASTDFDTLFEGPSKSWNIIGNLLQPIFNAGKNRRRVEITESRQRQMLYAYERTILQAFRETEDALVAYRKTGEQRQAQADARGGRAQGARAGRAALQGRRRRLPRGARRPALALRRRARRGPDASAATSSRWSGSTRPWAAAGRRRRSPLPDPLPTSSPPSPAARLRRRPSRTAMIALEASFAMENAGRARSLGRARERSRRCNRNLRPCYFRLVRGRAHRWPYRLICPVLPAAAQGRQWSEYETRDRREQVPLPDGDPGLSEPPGVDRRTFLMRSAVVGAAAVITGRVVSAEEQAKAATAAAAQGLRCPPT